MERRASVALLFNVILAAVLCFYLQAGPAVNPATLFQQGRLQEAERALKQELSTSPGDPRALMLMAVVLDAQKRFEEAEAYYRRAAKAAPRAAQVWNNFGNHWLTRGRTNEARDAFERALKIDPGHTNANLQLARIAVAQGRGSEAVPHLVRLRAAESDDPALLVLYGRALADNRDYAAAERIFAAALERVPGNLEVRLNLGLAALSAGNYRRALEIFESARKQEPENPDVLYGLTRTYVELGQLGPALGLAPELKRLAAEREDVWALLARLATIAGFHADAAQAWDAYLKLNPGSSEARRERAFSYVRAGEKHGLADLEAFVAKHPNDAVAHFELGIAYTTVDTAKAIAQLDRALTLDPNMGDAHYVRGTLLAQQGKLDKAVPDLERAVKLSPNNPKALDRLGQIYRSTGRLDDAERLLRRAVELDPSDGATAMHLALVLRDAGKDDESKTYFAKFKELGGEQRHRPPRGLLEFLSLSPEQRTSQYLANLRRAVEEQPANEDLRLRLGTVLLESGSAEEAEEVLKSIQSESRLDEAAGALLAAERFTAAKEILERSGKTSLNYALAVFHLSGADAGLAALDRIPEPSRDGNYWLARAQMLDAQGQLAAAVDSLNRGFASAPTRIDLYHEAATLLMKHGRTTEAVDLTKKAADRFPDEPVLLLDHAVALEVAGQFEEARALLGTLERRWPEWSRPWTVHGISFMARGKAADALPLLETAAALGDDSAELHFYLAEALASLSPKHRDRALAEVSRAIALDPADPYAQALAGRLKLEAGDPRAALDHLERSVELLPNLAQAHYQLVRVYSALGDKDRAKAQAEIVTRLRSEGKDIDSEALRRPNLGRAR